MKITKPSPNLFLVKRESLYDDEISPCDGAFQVTVQHIDRRTVDCPSKVPAYKGETDWWYGEGENHRVENGMICRDNGTRVEWAINLKVSEIVEFVKVHGDCVVTITADGFYKISMYGCR